MTRPLCVESLEDRLAPSAGLTSWNEFNGNAQHTGISTVAAQPMDQILWQTSLDQQGTYFWHTGEPVFTPNDTVIVPIITSTGDTFELEAFNGATGALLWTSASSYIQPSYSWLPPYQPVYDSVTNRVYFAGPGGTLYYINNPDNPGSTTPTPNQVAFYGTANYTANESAYNSSIFIDTPLTVDNSGNVFFGFTETGSNPSGINDGGIGRVSATGAGTYVTIGTSVGVGSGSPAIGSAPAVSNDGSILYAAIDDSNGPYLVGVNATTLAPEYSVLLSVPNSDTAVELINQSSAAPMVAPDGTVFMGVFADNYDGSRGFMTHYSANLATEYTPGAFGWDDTASIIPTSMVPSYTGSSPYLILTKYNNYVAAETGSSGGNGVNEIAVLDPSATETDPNNDPNPNMLVMQQILTVTSPTEDNGYINGGYPDATREWCTNGTAVDPATDSAFINNEDGYSYRWDLATDTITQAVEITDGYGEPYTPTVIGPNGVVYAINGGTLFALGGYSNYTLTNVSALTPAVVGQSVTFTTNLASTNGGAVPTGSITYSYTSGTNDPLNSTPVTLGTVPLLNGQATFTTSALLPDHYHIIATYSGDATDGYAAGSTTLVQVILATPTTTVTSSAPSITAGQSVTFTATVDPDGVFFVPLGTVSFLDGSTLLGSVPLNSLDQSTSPSSSQVATFTTSSLPAGINSITAVYSGDLNFTGSTSSVLAQTVNQAPSFTSAPATSFTIGVINTFVVSASGFPAPTYTVTSGMLPSDLTLNASTGLLSGNPAAGTDNVYNLIITASNGVTPNATQSFTLTVDPPPTITTTTLPNWTVSQAYSQTIGLSGGTDPITFAVSSGSLPTGLSLDSSTGAITGTPTTITGSPFNFTVTATDAANATASQG
ncbi:MAG TPA: Ig-like domain repeat protein, partial [Gemmata sp.]|nr:Ig-like domain repeat protein [Gemmata sp.]